MTVEVDQGETLDRLLTRARQAHRADDLDAAVDGYRRFLDERPGHVAARVALGRALLASGDAAGAREELFTALQHDPDQMVARKLLAEASIALGDDLEAHRWLVEYLGVLRDDASARLLLAEVESRLQSDDAPLQSQTLARMYLEQGHEEKALSVLNSLRDAGFDDGELSELVARADTANNRRKRNPERQLALLRSWEARLKV